MATKHLHRRQLLSLVVALLMLMAGTLNDTMAQTTACRVTYTITGQWSGAFQGDLVIANTGTAGINGWTLTWAFPNGQVINQIWGASYTQSGANVTARDAGWNASIPTGGTQSFGFIASWSGTNGVPASFALNGSACSTGGTNPTPTSGGTNPTPTRTPTRTPTGSANPTPTRTPTPAPTTPTGSWPTPTGQQAVPATINVSGTFDGGMRRYFGTGDLGTGGQNEDQDPIFNLANGATLRNVILGAPAADGIHCAGSCTLQNVWWEDVGEDAATFRGSSSSLTYLVDGGGARLASDKIFQHNGAGTLTIRNFQAQNFSTFYRSCGNCSTQYRRNVIIQNVTLTAPGSRVAGINTNYGDTARFSNITIVGNRNMVVCQKYIGNNTGDEPTQNGTGPDSTNCLYSTSDITFR